MNTADIILIAHNIRSTHNVGSLIRSSNGLGVKTVYCTGYTPYPPQQNDIRLPHIRQKLARQIEKTALGALQSTHVYHEPSIDALIGTLRHDGYNIAALEQAPNAVPLPSYIPETRLALIVGREVEGIEPEVLEQVDVILEIPMLGTKESYNVAVAAGMALYHCRFGTSTA